MILPLNLPFIPRIGPTKVQLFEVFGFLMWCVLVIAGYREIKSRPGVSFERGAILLLPLFVSFVILVILVEYVEDVSWDYQNYEKAFRAVAAGGNPYEIEHYLYPPLFAQVMAFVYSITKTWLASTWDSLWHIVHYFHQCAQFFLVNIAYQLCSRFASRLGFSDLKTRLIVAGLFLFNFPLVRMLHLNQINLYVLITVLIALLALGKFPFLSGAAIALGTLIKLYPVMMAAPLAGMKKWKALAGGFVTGVIVILFQTNFGRDLSLWKYFIRFYLAFPAERESTQWIRNTTLLSLANNLESFMGLPEAAIVPFYFIGVAAVLTWVAVRFWKREKIYATLPPGPATEMYRNFGSLIDFACLALLITPTAWDHHFVIALPLALWAIAIRGREKPGWVGAGIVSIFILPPFDIFPFSFLRMFGVYLLLLLVSPSVLLKFENASE
ncbi:MAG TPA: glycosyltransferase family 87 protein [Anaerolineales bacterium]|nr:glycosyltransferase family 87 protein [Anaerolineales bacterium]